MSDFKENRNKISVVIPNLNSKMIDKTIASIKSSDYDLSRAEIIVVGIDEPGMIVEDDMVKFIRTSRPELPSTARNIGVRNAGGDVILFTDADCIVDREWISVLMECQRRGKSIVGGAVDFNEKNYWILGDNIAVFHQQLRTSPRRIVMREVLGTANFSIRKEIFVEAGGFDERRELSHAEDHEFQHRLRRQGFKIYFEPNAVVYHYPPRGSFISVVRHAKAYAQSGAVFSRMYPDLFRTRKWYWKKPVSLIAVSPAISLVHIVKLLQKHPRLRRYFYVMPVVFVFTLCWNFFIARAITR